MNEVTSVIGRGLTRYTFAMCIAFFQLQDTMHTLQGPTLIDIIEFHVILYRTPTYQKLTEFQEGSGWWKHKSYSSEQIFRVLCSKAPLKTGVCAAYIA